MATTTADWQQLSFEEAISQSSEYPLAPHGAHCLIWCKLQTPLRDLDIDDLYPRAAVLMHVRFDGKIGFPGGGVDASLTGVTLPNAQKIVIDAMNRELTEELNYDVSKHPITFADYLFTHTPSSMTGTRPPFYAHFFAHELSLEELHALEIRSLSSKEYGREVAGNFRVPLYTMSNGYSGFPAFLNNYFIGNARDQLTNALVALKILTQEEIDTAISSMQAGYRPK